MIRRKFRRGSPRARRPRTPGLGPDRDPEVGSARTPDAAHVGQLRTRFADVCTEFAQGDISTHVRLRVATWHGYTRPALHLNRLDARRGSGIDTSHGRI